MPSSNPPPAYSGTSPMPSSFNVMGAIKHAIDLVKSPASVMTAYRDSDPSVNSLIINYIVILAAIDFVGTLIGDLIFYNAGYAVVSAILYYILGVVQVLVVGYIIWKLCPQFRNNHYSN